MKVIMSQLRGAIIASFMCVFTCTYSLIYISSYLPEMTLWLGCTEQNKGYYVGIISSAYFVGALSTSYSFSWLSDKLGHRQVMTGILVANATFSLSVAFANNVITVLVGRFLVGTCETIFSSARATLSLYTDNETQAVAMASSMVAWALGLNVGTAIGGFVSSPATKYPAIFANWPIFTHFPYILPPLICTIFSIISAVTVFFVYPKSEVKSPIDIHRDDQQDASRSDHRQHHNSLTDTDRISDSEHRIMNPKKNALDSDQKPHAEYSKVVPSQPDIKPQEKDIDDEQQPLLEHHTNCIKKIKNSILYRLLNNGNVVRTVIAYTLSTTVSITYLEVFALWASTKESLGGLEYSTNDIGLVVVIVALPCAVLQVIVAPVIDRRIGSISATIGYIVIFTTTVTLVPLSRFIRDRGCQWITLILAQCLVTSCEAGFGICTSLLINNSVSREHVGAANGLTRMTVTLSKTIYSIIVGGIYSQTVSSNVGSPIDISMTFVVLGATIWTVSFIIYSLPRTLNSKSCNDDGHRQEK